VRVVFRCMTNDGSPISFVRLLTKAASTATSPQNNTFVMLTTTPSTTGPRDAVPHVAETCSDYLLVCEARATSLAQGSWRFTLESSDGTPVFTAGDDDIGDLNRLTLLASVRGLEAIDGAAAITLLSNNRYLIRSLSESLPRWRDNGFVWEHFGRRIEVQHADLWRRIDRALSIHRVEACLISSRLVSSGGPSSKGRRLLEMSGGGSNEIRVDSPHLATPAPKSRSRPKDELRRWLLGSGASGADAAPRRRFTSADLLATP
jgi:ribonuclease HI